ncbi:hypothetical protein [Actinophytocola xanthii]|uniref:Uncharacterized protein n=1 Tax=Actinophytocola xanthii TaxID=1912961 RepID=A0A1Q8CKR3_9PSEU|nr:hypothetical protein [Actinophytocola xanthii]OLF14950.1 hypothetical protein BU204_24780 [Actinophytocola xanthii]
MSVRGPLVTAAVVVAGLVGFMTINSVGGLVVAGDNTDVPPASEVASSGEIETTDPETTEPPTSEPPASDTTESQPTESPEDTDGPVEEEPPAAPPFPAEAVYAGEVDKGPMTIAVAVKGEEAAAYLCDGATVESWLQGSAVDGRLDLKSKDGKNRVVGSLQGRNLTGKVTVGGRELPFTAPVATAPAGVYRGEGAEATIGWIILPDGSQVGIAKSRGGSEPAPRLDPAKGAVTLDGQRIEADKVAGDTTF